MRMNVSLVIPLRDKGGTAVAVESQNRMIEAGLPGQTAGLSEEQSGSRTSNPIAHT